MSLFQAREWWTVASGNAEEYTYGALSVGNVDNDPTPRDKIVVGSLNGILRVYYPTHCEFKIDHLLMEEQLEYPILQIEVGRFVPHSTNVGIAVLHPKHLAVYCLDGVGGSGTAASYFRLTKKYEHPLGLDGEHFTAFNMAMGGFGKSPEKDHICVQSLDGRLQFFEQDRFSFMQQLPTCLVPGSLCYAAATDSLITATSDLHVECYRYQVMATSVVLKKKSSGNDDGAKDAKEAKGVTAVKALHSEWRANLGEPVLDIRTGKFHWAVRARSFDVVVLGEFSLFCLTPSGDICFHKRLGFHPSSLCLYSRPTCDNSDSTDSVIIATHAKQWMIYRDAQLIWSAVAPTVSTALNVASFGGIDGMIVSLDEDGRLNVNYLGTDPPTTSVTASDAKEVNYEEMDEEHRTLLNIIRRSQGERRTEPKERVLLRAQVPALLDPPSQHSEADLRAYSGRDNGASADDDVVTGPDHKPVALTMRVYVTYTGSNVLSNVTIAITPPPNVVVCGPTSILLDSIDGKASTPLILPVVLRPSASVMPSSLEVTISAAYTLESGQPRTSLCTVKLPMCMMCRLIPPVKASTFKFTLDTNQEPPQLTELFDDMLAQPGATPDWAKQVTGSSANVLSFQYYNGVDVTILVSKNAGRYRIQSTELDALWMVSNELVDRLQLLHVQQTQGDDDDPSALPPPLQIQYQEPLPLADFFAAIDEHFGFRKEAEELHAELNDRAHQFRVIQKRLLVRYKDRNPSPLNCLDMLLHGTYSQILDLSRRVDHVQSKLHVSGNRLACSVHLLLMLIRYKFDLDDDNFAVLRSHLSPRVADAWEEATEAAMTDLLKTSLAVKKETAAAAAGVPVELMLPEDTKKLKKHITIVCDRLSKGGRLVGGSSFPSTAADGKSNEADNDGGKEDNDDGAKH